MYCGRQYVCASWNPFNIVLVEDFDHLEVNISNDYYYKSLLVNLDSNIPIGGRVGQIWGVLVWMRLVSCCDDIWISLICCKLQLLHMVLGIRMTNIIRIVNNNLSFELLIERNLFYSLLLLRRCCDFWGQEKMFDLVIVFLT